MNNPKNIERRKIPKVGEAFGIFSLMRLILLVAGLRCVVSESILLAAVLQCCIGV